MITYKSNGVNSQYTGGAVVIKDAAEALHFFEASGEKTIGISGPLRVAADAGTATYTVTGAGSLGNIFTWSVEGGGGLTWSISSGGVLTIPSGVAAGTTASIMLKFGDVIVAGQQIVIEAGASQPDEPEPEEPSGGGEEITIKATLSQSSKGINVLLDKPSNNKMSSHDPADNTLWTIDSWEGSKGTGAPKSVKVSTSESAMATQTKSVSADYSSSSGSYSATATYGNGGTAAVTVSYNTETTGNNIWISSGYNFVPAVQYTIVISWK